MIPCPNNLGYKTLALYQHLLQLVHGTTKKTYLRSTSQDGPHAVIQIFSVLSLKFVLSVMDKLYGGEGYRSQTGIQSFGVLCLQFIKSTMVDRTDDGKGYVHFDLATPGNNKEVSYTASGNFSIEEVTFYACVESPFTPDDPVGDLITLLSSNMLPSPSSRLAQDPLEEMYLINYCNQHPLAHGTTFPLVLPCIDNKSPPSSAGHPCYPCKHQELSLW